MGASDRRLFFPSENGGVRDDFFLSPPVREGEVSAFIGGLSRWARVFFREQTGYSLSFFFFDWYVNGKFGLEHSFLFPFLGPLKLSLSFFYDPMIVGGLFFLFFSKRM